MLKFKFYRITPRLQSDTGESTQTTQFVSAVYKDGAKIIESMTHVLKDWMFRHNYNTIEEFRGNASQKNIKKPVLYQRTQFMRYFSDASYK